MSGSGEDDGSQYIKVSFDPDPGFALTFDGMTATEELGRPFLIELNLSSGKARGNIDKMLGSSVTVEMTGTEHSKTYYNGILTRATYTGVHGGVYRYHVELRPWIWLLTRTQDCKIFQNKNAWDIIQEVFKGHNFSALRDARKNQSGSTVLEYCVQYRESAYNFVMRLMEQYGIYYFFEHKDGEHTLVFSDDPNSHAALPDALPFDFGQTEQRAVEDHVWEWTSALNLSSGAYTHRHYNFTTPTADSTAKSLDPGSHKYGDMEVFDYPGTYNDISDGQTLAGVRMQEHKARMQVFNGRSNARGLRSGIKFSLSETADTAMSQEYLVTHAVASVTMAESNADTRGQLVDSHRVSFAAIPGKTPFRLEQTTAKPTINGLQTALVVGDSGEEITTEQYGRIKVQFPWDRVGSKDQNSSCWVRVAQSMAGAGWGSMFIPRIGMEVVVGFLEGNPDYPLVTGVVYNAQQTVPYPLPAEKTKTTMKSNTSKGGGGFNELRFEDKKDSEEIFMQAQKDYNWKVLNNETGSVKKDQTITVEEGNRSVTVSKGNHSTMVSQGGHALSVSAGGSKTSTEQAFEVTANTSIKLTATASIELTCGGASIKISPSGITISAPQISGSADATMSLDGGGKMTLNAGIISIN